MLGCLVAKLSVKYMTPDFSSGHDLGVVGLSPSVRLRAGRGACLRHSLLPLPLPLFTLSQIIIFKKKKKLPSSIRNNFRCGIKNKKIMKNFLKIPQAISGWIDTHCSGWTERAFFKISKY